tara:strand:+ start:94 stop:276 length:183 start_codon:yes stop_codon:yes gene_type:complete
MSIKKIHRTKFIQGVGALLLGASVLPFLKKRFGSPSQERLPYAVKKNPRAIVRDEHSSSC